MSIVYEYYYNKLSITEIKRGEDRGLGVDSYRVHSDTFKAKKVYDGLKKRFTPKNLATIVHIFCCDSKNFELELLYFIIKGFSSAKELQNLSDRRIYTIYELEREFFSHIHKLKGFLRFEELSDGTLYAKSAPKFFVLKYLGDHFKKRLGSETFIIHDTLRGFAFLKNQDSDGIFAIDSFETPTLSEDEKCFQNLWKIFFESVSIKERKNIKLQNSLIPKHYREWMVEFKR